MAKKHKARRKVRLPEKKDIWIPTTIMVGEKSELLIGNGTLRSGTLVVEFKTTLPAVALQRTIERGAVVGIQFVMIAEDEKNVATQERLEREAEESAKQEKIEEEVTPESIQDLRDAAELEYISSDADLTVADVTGDSTIPVYWGEAGAPNRPEVGRATINSDGTADVVWTEGKSPFSHDTPLMSVYSEDSISVREADVPLEETTIHENNKENN